MSVLSLFFFFVGCSEQGLNNLPKDNDLVDTDVPTDTDVPIALSPDIEVTPLEIDFGPAEVGVARVEPFVVANVGEAPLSVSSITIADSTAFAVGGAVSFDLDPGQDTVVEVTYLPSTGQSIGRAVVASNDPDEPQVDVALLGSGALPDLVVSPDVHDFGDVELTCEETKSVFLSNVGGDVLTIDAISYAATDASLVLGQPNLLPIDVPPGDSIVVDVVYTPEAAGVLSEGTLVVSSNDPDGDVSATQTGAGLSNEGLDTSVVPPDPPLDILFFVDQSGSMDDRNADMADALDDFVVGLGTVTTDWRIGVVTFDDGCLNTWFQSTTVGYEAAFQSAVLEGDQTDPDNTDTERLFTLAGRALQNTVPGGCNEVFRRADGFLHLIMISDENEQSHDPDELRPPYDVVTGAVGVYEQYVNSPGMLSVSAVANLTNDCQSQPDPLAQGADRYIEIAGLTGGVALDICTNQWGPQMAELGSSLPTEYAVPLSAVPEAGSIQVTVGGALLIAGWSYDPIANAVSIETIAGQLAPGTPIEVAYTLPAVCAP